MPDFDTIQTSFLGGEFGPRALGRLDLDLYAMGCSTLLNFIVHPHGGISRRGGSRYIARVKDHSKITILHDFNYKNEKFFVLEFGDKYVRFYMDQAQIVNTYAAWDTATIYVLGDLVTEDAVHYRCIVAHTSDVFATDLAADKWEVTLGFDDVAYEIPTSYLESELKSLRFDDDGEALYIAHNDHFPCRLKYTSDNSWAFENLSFISFWKVPSVAGTGYVIGEVLTVTQAGASGGTLEVTAIDKDGGVTRYETLTHGTGYKIEAELATTSSIAGVGCKVDCVSASPPPEWGTANYPALVWFFEQRLNFAQTPDQPNGVWSSHSGDYHNFELGDSLDSEAINVRIKQANRILWSLATNLMYLGASNGEFLVATTWNDEAITPTNIRPIKAAGLGSSDLKAIGVDSSPVFIQRGGRKVRRLQFDMASNKYVPVDISILSDHITESGIVDLTYIVEPDSIIYCQRADGVIVGQTHDPVLQIFPWHRHIIGGLNAEVKSITGSVGKTSGRDELWMVVSRTIQEYTVQYIECISVGLHPEDDKEDAFFVDSGVTATGSSLEVVEHLDHLEGETIVILADGAVQAPQVVDDGRVTIDPSADTVHVGLPFTSIVDTLPLEGGNPLGTSQGRMKNIYNLSLRLFRSAGFDYGSPDGVLDTYYMGPPDEMGNAIPLFTGDTDLKSFPGDPDSRSIVRIQQSAPLPLTILAIMINARTEI